MEQGQSHRITIYSSQGNELTALLRRLEAATSRLEDIASTAEQGPANLATPQPVTAGTKSSIASDSTARDVSVAQSRPKIDLPPAITAMDELIDTDVKAFEDQAKDLDPLVIDQVGIIVVARHIC